MKYNILANFEQANGVQQSGRYSSLVKHLKKSKHHWKKNIWPNDGKMSSNKKNGE